MSRPASPNLKSLLSERLKRKAPQTSPLSQGARQAPERLLPSQARRAPLQLALWRDELGALFSHVETLSEAQQTRLSELWQAMYDELLARFERLSSVRRYSEREGVTLDEQVTDATVWLLDQLRQRPSLLRGLSTLPQRAQSASLMRLMNKHLSSRSLEGRLDDYCYRKTRDALKSLSHHPPQGEGERPPESLYRDPSPQTRSPDPLWWRASAERPLSNEEREARPVRLRRDIKRVFSPRLPSKLHSLKPLQEGERLPSLVEEAQLEAWLWAVLGDHALWRQQALVRAMYCALDPAPEAVFFLQRRQITEVIMSESGEDSRFDQALSVEMSDDVERQEELHPDEVAELTLSAPTWAQARTAFVSELIDGLKPKQRLICAASAKFQLSNRRRLRGCLQDEGHAYTEDQVRTALENLRERSAALTLTLEANLERELTPTERDELSELITAALSALWEAEYA